MKKKLKTIAVVLFAVFIVAQLFRPDRANQPILEGETLEFSAQVPENVAAILARSCNDCHANKTVYPWYSMVTPFNFFLQHHIEEGRQKLNFSVWNTYEIARKRRKLDEVCEQVKEGLMPLPSYLWIHRAAQLSDADAKILCNWTDAERARLVQTAQ